MKTPVPDHEEHDPLSAALRRDAARIRKPPFDPALHHAMLRRIRATVDPGAAQWSWWRRPALTGVAAFAVLALCVGLWLPRVSQNTAQPATQSPQPGFAAMLASSQAAVAGLSSDAWSPLPAWMSPTASLLDPSYLPSINLKPHQL